jgi:PAS domain S-box-containing protein
MVGVDSSGRIVLVNTQAEILFGYDRSELLGQQVEILVPDTARVAHPAHRSTYLTDRRSRPMGLGLQLAARRRDGSEFPAEISLATVEAGGSVLISASIRDLTERIAADREREQLAQQAERERTQRQVLQSQRLESLGQLAGGVAHDFNNLLAVITNYTAFVKEEVEREFERTGTERWRLAQRDITQVDKAAEAAARLTRQLLTFARREVVRPQAVDLNDVVNETVGLLERTLGEDIVVNAVLATPLDTVLADPGQLQLVLVNLAINSRHAMPDGGVLTIETANDTNASGDACVRLSVIDDGCGMDADTLSRAFEPFFTTRTNDQGTGLGLATVYGVITQVGGTVMIESDVSVGTSFTAQFPVAHAAAVESSPAGAPVPSAAGLVLVVDDEPALRSVVERMLSRNGFEVIVASDGAEALEIARARGASIDLVLTDVIMPTMSGPELVDELSRMGHELRALYMSGYAGSELSKRLAVGDAVQILEKPFTEAALVAAIVAALDGPSITDR